MTDRDDAATALVPHDLARRLREEERRLEVDAEHTSKVLTRERRRRLAHVDAGAVDQDVEAPQIVHGRRDQPLGRLAGADVDGERDDPAPQRAQRGCRALELVGAPRSEHQVGALHRQRPRNPQPEAAAAAGDNGHLAIETE